MDCSSILNTIMLCYFCFYYNLTHFHSNQAIQYNDDLILQVFLVAVCLSSQLFFARSMWKYITVIHGHLYYSCVAKLTPVEISMNCNCKGQKQARPSFIAFPSEIKQNYDIPISL